MSIGTALALPCAVELRNLPKRYQIRDLIQKDKQGFISKYRRMKGYAKLAKKMDIEMGYLFIETSKYLTPQEKRQLEWQAFRGFVQKLNQLKSKIKDKDGKIKQKFTGMYGYIKVAAKHFDGEMFITFMNVSAVLSEREFRKLGWRSFRGTVSEYNRLRSLITDENGNISSDFFKNYVGMDGQARFAQKHFDGNMTKASKNVSAVSSTTEFKKFGWQQFQGTVSEYNRLKSLITDEDGNIKQEFVTKYKGMEGYAKFAKEHFDGKMPQAFMNVSAVSSPREMKQLEWQKFLDTVSEYYGLKRKITDEKGKIKQEYKGMEGYAKFTQEHFDGKMPRAFQNVSTVLSPREKKQLEWQAFQGTVSEYNRLKSLITDEKGKIKQEYEGMDGLAKLAEEHFDGKMGKAFVNVSAVLSPREMTQLEWQQFQGTVSEYNRLKSLIKDEKGNIKQEYKGMEGYAKFAEEHFDGKMPQAFKNVSAVSSPREKKQLEWQKFLDTVSEYYGLKRKITDEKGKIKQEYKRMEGYAKFAKEHFDGNMLQAFVNVSAVLSPREKKQLGWQKFQGTVFEYYDLKSLVIDEDGNIKQEYKRMEGYAKFAEEHFDGNMFLTFMNISTVLSKNEFEKLGWQSFHGFDQEYHDLKSLITDEDGNIKQEVVGMDGQAEFAQQYFGGNMRKAFLNVSAVLSKSEFKKFGWQQFQGTVLEYNRLKSLITDESGNIRSDFLKNYEGMDGLARFAEEHFDGNMLRAFQNVSAVLGGILIMRELELGWKAFYGTTDQYSALIKLFEETAFEELQNPEGQQMVADLIFKGHKINAYKNVSSLKERLLNKKEDFKNLNWRR